MTKEISLLSKPLVEISPSIVIQSNTNDIYNKAIDILPELKSAIKNVESSKYDLRIARSGRFPTINVYPILIIIILVMLTVQGSFMMVVLHYNQ